MSKTDLLEKELTIGEKKATIIADAKLRQVRNVLGYY
jgi:hypothetical protein